MCLVLCYCIGFVVHISMLCVLLCVVCVCVGCVVLGSVVVCARNIKHSSNTQCVCIDMCVLICVLTYIHVHMHRSVY